MKRLQIKQPMKPWQDFTKVIQVEIERYRSLRSAARTIGLDVAALSRITRGLTYPDVLTLGLLMTMTGIVIEGIREVE